MNVNDYCQTGKLNFNIPSGILIVLLHASSQPIYIDIKRDGMEVQYKLCRRWLYKDVIVTNTAKVRLL